MTRCVRFIRLTHINYSYKMRAMRRSAYTVLRHIIYPYMHIAWHIWEQLMCIPIRIHARSAFAVYITHASLLAMYGLYFFFFFLFRSLSLPFRPHISCLFSQSLWKLHFRITKNCCFSLQNMPFQCICGWLQEKQRSNKLLGECERERHEMKIFLSF